MVIPANAGVILHLPDYTVDIAELSPRMRG